MKVKTSLDVSAREWDDIVLQCGGSFFHTYAYAAFEASKSHQKPAFIQLLDANDNCYGVAVACIETPKIWPFSAYCKKAIFGALPVAKTAKLLNIFMLKIEAELKSMGVFNIFHHAYESENSHEILSTLKYQLNNRSEFYIPLDKTEDELWKALKSSRRRNIRKAEKLNIESKFETTLDAIISLKNLQENALARKGVVTSNNIHIAERIKSVLVDHSRAITVTSYHKNKPLNAALFGFYNEKVYYIISGSSLEGNKVSGPAHMLWHAICEFKDMGYNRVNLGGVSESESLNQAGLYRFKKDFGAEIISQPSGEKLISVLGVALNQIELKIKHLLKRTFKKY